MLNPKKPKWNSTKLNTMSYIDYVGCRYRLGEHWAIIQSKSGYVVVKKCPVDLAKTNSTLKKESVPYGVNPDSMWLVEYECGYEVIRVSSLQDGFFSPGQEPCWGFSNIEKWLYEIKPINCVKCFVEEIYGAVDNSKNNDIEIVIPQHNPRKKVHG